MHPRRSTLRSTLRSTVLCARQLLGACGLWACTWASLAQTPAPVAPPAGTGTAHCPAPPTELTTDEMQQGLRQARDRGFLWRVSKSGRTSYLYGTIHLGQREWLVPGPTVLQAALQSEVIAVEMNLLDPKVMQQFQAALASFVRHPLPARLKRRLQTQVEAACVPSEGLETLTPEMLAVTVTALAARRDGLDPAYAIDPVFMGMARPGTREVVSLETPAQQLKLLHGRNAKETEELVTSMLTGLESGDLRSGMVRQAQMWSLSRHGELARYEEWCECTKTRADREMNKRLLDDRNPGLARGIDALHAGGRTVFAAVGSLHMVGPLGLPTLLEKRGYTVERVSFPP